jgi:GTPase SAR1 family protein
VAKRFNIVVCGSARVGKSTLVNALCGREYAQTSPSLSSKTDKIEKYVLHRVYSPIDEASNSGEYTITIWDTPGVESWTKDHIQKHFTQIMTESKPLCMIYCASPGGFARLDQLQWIIDTCIRSNIYCALVCTNKYSGGGQQRKQILNEFDSLLSNYHSMTKEENNVKYYGNIALCTSVNSIPYEDEEMGIRKGVEGLNELLFGITTSLKDDKLAAWCYTLADNESFWSTMGNRLSEFFGTARPFIEGYLQEHGSDIAKQLIPIILGAVLAKK